MDMDAEIKLACAVAEALTKNKTQAELQRLQIVLQTISSLIVAECACLKTAPLTETKGGASQ